MHKYRQTYGGVEILCYACPTFDHAFHNLLFQRRHMARGHTLLQVPPSQLAWPEHESLLEPCNRKHWYVPLHGLPKHD